MVKKSRRNKMNKGEMLYEGKAKRVFQTEDPDFFVIQYKDDATAFNGQKKGTIAGKAIVNNIISNILFEYLEKSGIPTHFVDQISEGETLVKAVSILPLEVIIRNVSAGSFSKRYGVPEGIPFDQPTLEFSYKNDDLGDPLINDDHILALELATEEQLEQIKTYAHEINRLLILFFKECGLKIIDFKLEFGLNKGNIILADEISPDTCRLWDIETNEKMDKDRFRRDLGNVEETYQAVLRRVTKR
jgi:phosphoribosylaminoimidazole-succinocarboxamide synthase